MIHLKKIITVSLLGTAMLVSINTFSSSNEAFTTIKKNIPGIFCTKYFIYGKEITECEIDRENVDPEELYSNLMKSQRAVVNCMKAKKSDGEAGAEEQCHAVIEGISCTRYYNVIKPTECDIDEETINPDQLFAVLMGTTFYQKDCYDNGRSVSCMQPLN